MRNEAGILEKLNYSIIVPAQNPEGRVVVERDSCFFGERVKFYVKVSTDGTETVLGADEICSICKRYLDLDVTIGLAEGDGKEQAFCNSKQSGNRLNKRRGNGFGSMAKLDSIQDLASKGLTGNLMPSSSSYGLNLSGEGGGLVESGSGLESESSVAIITSFRYRMNKLVAADILYPSPGTVLFPIDVEAEYIRTKVSREKHHLQINVVLSNKMKPEETLEELEEGGSYCNPVDIDFFNVFEAFSDDPLLEQPPKYLFRNQSKVLGSAQPSQQWQFTLYRTLPISTLYHVSVNTHQVSTTQAIVSVSLERNGDSDVETAIKSVDVFITNAMVNLLGESNLPSTLSGKDELQLLYQVKLLDGPGSSLSSETATDPSGIPSKQDFGSIFDLSSGPKSFQQHKRLLNIVIKSTPQLNVLKEHVITSNWYARLPTTPEGLLRNERGVVAYHGRRFEVSMKHMITEDLRLMSAGGIEVSFQLLSQVRLRQVFTVQVLLVNRSDRVRNLTLKFADSTTDSYDLPTHRKLIRPVVPKLALSPQDVLELLRAYNDNEETIVCLENDIDMSPMSPSSCQVIRLRYIVVKGRFHSIPQIRIIDNDSRKEHVIEESLQVFVEE